MLGSVIFVYWGVRETAAVTDFAVTVSFVCWGARVRDKIKRVRALLDP